jgi:hypothetical protein
MATVAISKVLASLPDTLAANAVYAVRVGQGFDLYIVDDTGQIAYTINLPEATPGPITAVAAPSYTLQASDAGNGILASNTDPVTITVPASTFAVGTRLPIRQGGTGAVTIGGDSGTTLDTPNGASTTGLGDGRVLEQVDTDTWMVW